MKCNLKKSLLILLVLLLVGQMVSCGSSGDRSQNTTDTTMETSAETEAAETEYTLEAEDFGGRTITVLAYDAGIQNFPFWEMLAEEQTGEVINDAVLERNVWLEEKYNIKLNALQTNPAGNYHRDYYTQEVASASKMYDMSFTSPANCFHAAINGQLYPIDTLPYIDTDQDWWLSYFNNATSVNNRQYFLGGDMNIGLLAAGGIVYFNKTVQEEHNVEDLYALAESGKFTIEKFKELCELVTADTDGDGSIGDADRIGFRGNTYSFQMFLYGFGNLLVEKDEKDTLLLNFDENITEKIITVIELMNYKPCVQQPNLEAVGFPGFMNDLSLFMTQPAYQFSVMRDMESDYGILPFPKYDETQDHYYAQVHTSWSSVTALPVTIDNSDTDMLGKIIEDMAYISHQLIRPAFYNTLLQGKYTRDEQSGRIMDMIFQNIIVDFAYLMEGYNGFNFDGKTREFTASGNTNIASFAASVMETYENALQMVNDNW